MYVVEKISECGVKYVKADPYRNICDNRHCCCTVHSGRNNPGALEPNTVL